MTTRDYDYGPLPDHAGLLVVFAHPDDEVTCFGGMIPYYIARGKKVVALCMTRGGGDGNDITQREGELRDCLWTCGLRHEPLWADFPDCGFIANRQFESLDWVWQQWGGREAACDYMMGIYKRFAPTVVMAHNPITGDYGHPNHMASGWACVDAFDADDRSQAMPLKLYITSREQDAWRVDWNQPSAYFNGKTPAEVATAGLRCHRSQAASRSAVRDDRAYQLYRSRVGEDVVRRDIFENCPKSK